MTVFTVSIAGLLIEIHALFPESRDFCRDYITDIPEGSGGTPDFTVIVSEEDIKFERAKSAQQDAADGRKPREYRDSYLETRMQH